MATGTLRIYLGAAPGVGKTFAMLDEGFRRRSRGTDVVVGYVETHGRPRTEGQIRNLEVIPRAKITYRDQRFEEMDLAAILRRRPAVVLVDELAHTNVPGAGNAKRWEDVNELLRAGIDVITTLNIQHLESLNDVVERITGIKQQETVPDAVVRAADQVEIVDMTPEALRRRMAHGNIYAPEKVDAALGNYFRVGNLTALRELALLWVADRVDESLQDYMVDHGISEQWETRERVVVAVTGAPSGEQLIRRAARMAARSKADLLGVHVRADDGLTAAPSELLERHRKLVEDLGGSYHEVIGSNVGTALSQFARAENATQVVLGATRRSRWSELTKGAVISSVLRELHGIDVHVMRYDDSGDTPEPRLAQARSRLPSLPRSRQMAGFAIAILGTPIVTFLLSHARSALGLPGDLMVYLLLVVAAATAGGIGPAVVAAIATSLTVNWYFTPPIHTFTIDKGENVLALGAFLVIGLLLALLVTRMAERTVDAGRAGAEAEALARVAAGLVGEDDPLPSMLARLRSTFGLDRAEVAVRTDDSEATDGWRVETAAGGLPAAAPLPSIPLGAHAELRLWGPTMAAADQRVLQAFAAQLGAALERRQMQAEADAAMVVSAGDALRTALLRAVSHDLRTPLASIKASVTSLLQQDVDWPAEAVQEFLTTIDEEADRLDSLVANLLDMSRLQTGAVEMTKRAVGWEEVVAAAVASLSTPTDALVVNVPESLPDIAADPALLERSVANIIGNALQHAPEGTKVRVEAGAVGGAVDLRVIDQGPGIAPADRSRLFAPFQRQGDQANANGVGLGLAVARGFVEAMGGTLEIEDTPGGGLTMVIRMLTVA